MNKILDPKILQMWELAYTKKYCIVTWASGHKQCINPTELKGILSVYEMFLISNSLTQVEDSNSRIHANIDDRFTRFCNLHSILEIEFTNSDSEGKNG